METVAGVLVSAVPASSFLYPKLIPELASRGYDALSFDLPGLGLADRSPDLDHSTRGLGGFSAAAVNAFGLGAFHLVVHAAGGPVGFELALRMQDRIRSPTVLNTTSALSPAPYPGELFARVAGRMPGPMTRPDVWRLMMRRVGVADEQSLSDAELDAWRVLALGPDGGARYLRTMRSLRPSHRGDAYTSVLDSTRTPYTVAVMGARSTPS